jgi:trans-2,3-dihydro-3-hydroxyanthranilate isomerase
MSRELHYTLLDVFAERVLEGNQLAVFHDARGLSDAEMQALAREMNLSESTFVFPSDDPQLEREQGIRVRVFTTQEELPFAGHPTLGTASWLLRNYAPLQGAQAVTLNLNVGPIRVEFADGHEINADESLFGTMRQNDPVFGAEFDRAEVARVIGLAEADLLNGFSPQLVSTGSAFCIVALRDVATLGRLAISQREAAAWLRERGGRWFYCIAPDDSEAASAQPKRWRARMQFYSGEDPATGSAAGPCIAWLVRVRLAASALPIELHQGVEMHRPSRLVVQASSDLGRIHDVRVGGRTIPVAKGRLFLPVVTRYSQGVEP